MAILYVCKCFSNTVPWLVFMTCGYVKLYSNSPYLLRQLTDKEFVFQLINVILTLVFALCTDDNTSVFSWQFNPISTTLWQYNAIIRVHGKKLCYNGQRSINTIGQIVKRSVFIKCSYGCFTGKMYKSRYQKVYVCKIVALQLITTFN